MFYSEQTEHSLVGADGESKAHCLHCGKEVHIVTATHEHDSVASRTSHTDVSQLRNCTLNLTDTNTLYCGAKMETDFIDIIDTHFTFIWF